MTLAYTHQQLLTRANKVRAAAMDRDTERLRREVQSLLDVFLDHTASERATLARLPAAAADAVGRGQKRVLERLLTLSMAAEQDEVDQRCSRLGLELTTLLGLQAETERRAFAHEETGARYVTAVD